MDKLPDNEDVYEECEYCKGTGKIKHKCRNLKYIQNHPLNQKFSSGPYSEEGFLIKQCPTCNRVFGIRYQYDEGTGSDDRYHDYGIGDPFKIATKMIVDP